MQEKITERRETQTQEHDDVDIGKSVFAQKVHIAESPQKTGPVQKGPKSKLLMMVIVVSILCSSVTTATYDRFFAQKIVKVNMQQYLSKQRELYFAGKLSKEEVENNLGRYINSIKNQPKNRVVVLEDVIASGAEKLNP